MAKSSGGVRSARRKARGGGLKGDGGGQYKGKKSKIGSLKDLKNTQLRRTLQQGISKYESRLGVRTTVRIADLSGAYGVHVTQGGKSAGVFLDRDTFEKANVSKITKIKRDAYKTKFLNSTNKPVQHTVIHELGHATWNSHLTGKNQVAAGKEVQALYKRFQKADPKKWGSYGKSNINEFFAEGITKAVIGKADRWGKALVKIVKKHKL